MGTSKRVWEFPKSRFVAYEPRDEWWCRYFGIGREVMEYPVFLVGGTTVVMHPAVAEKFRQECGPIIQGGVPCRK